MPIHDRCQINKPTRYRDICYIRTPHLIRPGYIKIPQKIWIHFMLGVRLTGIRFWADGLDPLFYALIAEPVYG